VLADIPICADFAASDGENSSGNASSSDSGNPFYDFVLQLSELQRPPGLRPRMQQPESQKTQVAVLCRSSGTSMPRSLIRSHQLAASAQPKARWRVSGSPPSDHCAYLGIRQAAAAWSSVWQAERLPTLTYKSAPHFVQISDQRRQGEDGTYTFEDSLADLYLACSERLTTAAAIQRKLDLRMPAAAIQEILEDLRQRGLMFLDGRYALALALPAPRFQ
jgi:hypothetical protein